MRNYDKYKEQMQKIADLGHTAAVLHWDKEVNIPEGGNAFRSRQLATLSGIIHEEFTSPALGELMNNLVASRRIDAKEKKNIKVTLEEYNKATRFSKEFVMKKSMAVSQAFQAWEAARKANDFSVYVAPLDNLIKIIREEASIIGDPVHPYNALLHQYEPGLTVAKLDAVFTPLKENLGILIDQINCQKPKKYKFLTKRYDANKQWDFGLYLLKQIGYDFNFGRQDISTHPFTTSFSPQDVRVTTRIDEKDFCNMTWSCIHEGGHALYEQGLNIEEYGLPSGSAISLAIHESQSRLWENNVGRGMPFWKSHFSALKRLFPNQLKVVKIKRFYKAINQVGPNLIRTEADELHYHMHVMIRYDIERLIMEGAVATADLKDLWNEKYKEYLGVKVPDDKNGILQDVHWAHGTIGYFPTYSLGSLYAAQFYNQANMELPGLNDQLALGDSSVLLRWLREKIHIHGRRYEAEELCQMITGEPLNPAYFLDYVEAKYSEIYNL